MSVLGSGSRGNSLYLRFGDLHCLVDAGLSYTEIKRRLTSMDVDIASIGHVFVTHEHTDHISALRVLTKRQPVSLYCTSKTYLQIGEHLSEKTDIQFSDHPLIVGGITVTPFPVSHDAVDPVGYTFSANGRKISVTTDLGHVNGGVLDQLKDSDVLVIESNHDETMLWNGPYTWPLKQRIAGNNGHLSNRQTAEALESVYHHKLKYVFLAHLSQENNNPDIALKTVNEYLHAKVDHKARVMLTDQRICTRVIHL